MGRKLIIWIEEEYGYRYWKWEVSMKLEALVEWWKNLESVDAFFFNPSKTLPFGKVKQVGWDEFKTGRLLYLHLHTDGDSYLNINLPADQLPHHLSDGSMILHAGYDPDYFGRDATEETEVAPAEE